MTLALLLHQMEKREAGYTADLENQVKALLAKDDARSGSPLPTVVNGRQSALSVIFTKDHLEQPSEASDDGIELEDD